MMVKVTAKPPLGQRWPSTLLIQQVRPTLLDHAAAIAPQSAVSSATGTPSQPLSKRAIADQQIEVRRAAFPTRRQEVEVIGRLGTAGRDQMQTHRHGSRRVAIGHMHLDAAARVSGMLAGRRHEMGGSEAHAGQSQSIQRGRQASPSSHGAPTTSNGSAVPRPSDRFVPSMKHVPG